MRIVAKSRRIFVFCFLTISVFHPSPLTAGAYEDGRAAISAGDYRTAIRLLMPLARRGNPAAQNAVGALYMEGWGVKRNYTEAIKWFQRASERGESSADWNLGRMYENGLGVTQNCDEAVRWYRKPAERNDPKGQVNLGSLYDIGTKCIAEDPKEAVIWYRKAAMQGDPLGQMDLGAMYATGRGVAGDYTEAVSWYRKAAAQGNAQAQFRLGAMYELGEGVTQNKDEALKWYQMAAQQGHRRAIERIGALPGSARQDAEVLNKKVDFLVTKCTERGNNETTCRYIIEFEAQTFGPKFVEAAYLQAVGDLAGYEKKLHEAVAENPKAFSRDMATQLDARAREQCIGSQ